MKFIRSLSFSSFTVFIALCSTPAEAILNYNIFESSGNLVVQANGSLNLGTPVGLSYCGIPGALYPSLATICAGPDQLLQVHRITGPASFPGGLNLFADSVAGISSAFTGFNGFFGVDFYYNSGDMIDSSASFSGYALADFGWQASAGTLATWTLLATGDTINVTGVAPVPAPAPLPVVGACAALGFSRRLRQRIRLGNTPSMG